MAKIYLNGVYIGTTEATASDIIRYENNGFIVIKEEA